MATKASTPVATTSFTGRKRVRKTFGKIHEVVQMPNLIEVQRESYEHFLRSRPADGYVSGLEKTLRSVFPIRDFAGTSELDFVHYELEEPKYDTEECRQRGMTYAAPMRVTLRLIVFEVDAETEARSVLDIKEQDVYMGDMPLMTGNGTFIINGTERVIVSQLHRSPGVFFDHDRGKTHSSGKLLYSARIIPYRGSWLDFEFDAKDALFTRIDRRRKLPVTVLLRALAFTNEQMLKTFYEINTFNLMPEGVELELVAERLRGETLNFDLSVGGKVIVEAGKRITARHVKQLEKENIRTLEVPDEYLVGRILAHDVIDQKLNHRRFADRQGHLGAVARLIPAGPVAKRCRVTTRGVCGRGFGQQLAHRVGSLCRKLFRQEQRGGRRGQRGNSVFSLHTM